jgi:hypothetical protein
VRVIRRIDDLSDEELAALAGTEENRHDTPRIPCPVNGDTTCTTHST